MCEHRPGFRSVIAGLDPAIHHLRKKMEHRVTPLRGGPVMTAVDYEMSK
jgi:hypothetical protein